MMVDENPHPRAYPGLPEMIDGLVPAPPQAGEPVWMEAMNLDLPLELYVRPGEAGLAIEASLPTQTFPTSILPVFHRLTLRLRAEPGDAE